MGEPTTIFLFNPITGLNTEGETYNSGALALRKQRLRSKIFDPSLRALTNCGFLSFA